MTAGTPKRWSVDGKRPGMIFKRCTTLPEAILIERQLRAKGITARIDGPDEKRRRR